MKSWTIPTAVGQQFAADEYVSACGPMTLKCDLCIENTGAYSPNKVYDKVHIASTMRGGEFDGQEFHKSFQGCGKVFEVPVSQLSVGTVTHYANLTDKGVGELCTLGGKDHWLIPLEEEVEAYFWVTDGGKNGHATIVTEPSKS